MSEDKKIAPMTDKEAYVLQKVAEWWNAVCAQSGMEPAIDEHRASLEAAYAYMMECRARAQMPPAPTRIQ